MIETKSIPKPNEGTGLWLLKILSGALIIVLLLVHFIVNHYAPEGALLTWEGVVAYYANPWIVLMEIIFLVVVVTHALIGMRSIILDLNPSKRIMGVIDWLMVLIGTVSVIYGVWLALTVAAFSA